MLCYACYLNRAVQSVVFVNTFSSIFNIECCFVFVFVYCVFEFPCVEFLNNILCMKNWSIVYAHHQQKKMGGSFIDTFSGNENQLQWFEIHFKRFRFRFDLMQFTANLFTQESIYFKSTSINKADRSKNRVFLTEIHTKLNTNWFQKKKHWT